MVKDLKVVARAVADASDIKVVRHVSNQIKPNYGTMQARAIMHHSIQLFNDE